MVLTSIVINPQDGNGEDKFYIPSKRFADMYRPDCISEINYIETDTENLSFWWAEAMDGLFCAEVLFMKLNNLIYCFTEEATWLNRGNGVEGYEEIPSNILTYDIILKNYFSIGEEKDEDVKKNKYKEFSLILLGCCNLEFSMIRLSFEELLNLIEEKTGYKFIYFKGK